MIRYEPMPRVGFCSPPHATRARPGCASSCASRASPTCGGEGLGAGLLQMSKEFEEELLLPCSELHFAPDGSIIGVSAQDVERDTAHDTKVCRRVVLARSSVIFVEDDVEGPVQLIFHTPMPARHFEHALG